MPNLIDRLKRIRARCTKPTKAEREHGCCGYLLTHADLGRVVELFDAAEEFIQLPGHACFRIQEAIGRMRESNG